MTHPRMDLIFLDRVIAASPPKVDPLAGKLKAYLLKNYAPGVLGWVDSAKWQLKAVRLADIQMAKRPAGGRDMDKVDSIAEAVRSGKQLDPVVLVQTAPHAYKIADGFHRTLGLQKAGKRTTMAYVGTDVEGYDHVGMHEAKLNDALEAGRGATETNVDGNKNTSPLPRQRAFPVSPPSDVPSERYPTTAMTVHPSGAKINVKVADTPALRKTGLSNTPDPTGEDGIDGMLFTFPGIANQALQNKDVDYPVSAQWFSSDTMFRDGQLHHEYLGHTHMGANDPTPARPPGNHGHILEVPTSQWDALGLGPGSSISMDDEKQQQGNGVIDPGSQRF